MRPTMAAGAVENRMAAKRGPTEASVVVAMASCRSSGEWGRMR